MGGPEKDTIVLTPQSAELLVELAERGGMTLECAAEQAIANEDFIERQLLEGARLLVKRDGELRVVEFH